MKKTLLSIFSVIFLFGVLAGCTFQDELVNSENDVESSIDDVITSWESFLPSIQAENIKNVEWIIYGGRELPSNDEVAQLIRGSVSS